MNEHILPVDFDELDVDSIHLPDSDTLDTCTTGYATTEIGASCGLLLGGSWII